MHYAHLVQSHCETLWQQKLFTASIVKDLTKRIHITTIHYNLDSFLSKWSG